MYYGIASQFRPAIAKYLYLRFNSINVLDPCAGWGDRCIGALATPNVQSYVGIDTNIKLEKSYNRMIRDFGGNKKVKMIYEKAEDVDYSKIKYDFVFTSIPYWNIEKYRNMPEYGDYGRWKDEFLRPMITKIFRYLTQNRYFCINTKDIDGHKITKDIDKIFKILGAKKEKSLKYSLHGRYPKTDYYNYEPILVYKKQ